MDADRWCWISWHCSRRSRTLSRAFNAVLYERQIEGGIFGRHGLSALWTISLLYRHRPRTILLQYSFLLMVILALYKKFSPHSVVIVADCHTKALRRTLGGAHASVFSALKRKSLASADFLIVSNSGLLREAKNYNENCFVLSDPIPTLPERDAKSLRQKYCVFVMSYAEDEPVSALFKAAEKLSAGAPVYFTGLVPDAYRELTERESAVVFTGFLPDAEYASLLVGASCIVAMTTDQDCLLCAGYEALAVNVPFVTSDTNALREYFGSAAIFAEHEAAAIAAAVERAFQHNDEYGERLAQLKTIRESESIMSLRPLHARIIQQHQLEGYP